MTKSSKKTNKKRKFDPERENNDNGCFARQNERESEELEFDDCSEVDYDVDYTVQTKLQCRTNLKTINSTED